MFPPLKPLYALVSIGNPRIYNKQIEIFPVTSFGRRPQSASTEILTLWVRMTARGEERLWGYGSGVTALGDSSG